MQNQERSAAIALAACQALDRKSLRKLVHAFGGASAVWQASVRDWLTSGLVHATTVQRLQTWRESYDADKLLEDWAVRGIQPIYRSDDAYPMALNDLADPPLVLFVKGQWTALSPIRTSVVGTRRASSYGVEAATWVAETMAAAGCTVVSGLALGIDTAAHRGALSSDGHTIAVLGCGVDVCYPPSNAKLYRTIAHHGALISEYAPGTPVEKWYFPERNRLIAALGTALCVVQAGEQSGALRTVDYALELGREVFVVPGPITSVHCRGSNRLIQDGSQVLLDPNDCLKVLGLRPRNLDGRAVPIRWRDLYHLLDQPLSASQLSESINSPMSMVYAGLLELELDGWIERLPGGLYRHTLGT